MATAWKKLHWNSSIFIWLLSCMRKLLKCISIIQWFHTNLLPTQFPLSIQSTILNQIWFLHIKCKFIWFWNEKSALCEILHGNAEKKRNEMTRKEKKKKFKNVSKHTSNRFRPEFVMVCCLYLTRKWFSCLPLIRAMPFWVQPPPRDSSMFSIFPMAVYFCPFLFCLFSFYLPSISVSVSLAFLSSSWLRVFYLYA